MKLSSFFHFAAFGVQTILLRKKSPILGTVIVTDKCNLHCKHCSVNNITAIVHPYEQIWQEMQRLYDMGVRILFFCGGETFLWKDGERTLRDLVIEAKNMGFLIVNVVTNGTFPIDLPEADLMLKDAGVTKISIGIQSFCDKYQKILGRKKIDTAEMMSALSAVSFETVSMDFIFALPGQTYDDLKSDIDAAFLLGANHVAIYPFIDFTFTESPVTAMPKKDKRELLDAITQYCLGKGYSRNSIWTFSSGTDANYSSMTRDNFLGFGCSATSLFKEQFKINTFDVDSYCERIRSGNLATSLTIRFTKRQRMVYWLFWTAYSTRVTAEDFEKFFGVSLKKMYGFELWVAKQLGLFKEHNGTYEMTLKGAFYYHYYENFYTLSYIDKMWGIMRKEAFPEQIEL